LQPARPAAVRAAHALEVATSHAPTARPTDNAVRDLMWRHVGLLRDRAGLEQANGTLACWWSALRAAATVPDGAVPNGAVLNGAVPNATDRQQRRLEAIVTVGLLIASAALRREESRGAHFRSDCPRRDDIHWKVHVADRFGGTSSS
jgi:aspartate oxidase